mgnify:CR=1 FL=1
MTRAALLAVAAGLALGACATSSPGKYSYTPRTEVTVKGGKKKDAQANYQVSPEAKLGSAGSGAGDR